MLDDKTPILVAMLATLCLLPAYCEEMEGEEAQTVVQTDVTSADSGLIDDNACAKIEAENTELGSESGYETENVDVSLGESYGDADRLFYLALAYEDGDGVTQDYAKAMDLYRQAALNGSAEAMNNIGYMYEKGLGVVQNLKEAVSWYEKSADYGDPNGLYNLAIAYMHGMGVERDLITAKLYLGANEKHEPSVELLKRLIVEDERVRAMCLVAEKGDRNAALWCAKVYDNESSLKFFDPFCASKYYYLYFYGSDDYIRHKEIASLEHTYKRMPDYWYLDCSYKYDYVWLSALDRDKGGPSQISIMALLKEAAKTNVAAIVELARSYANPEFRLQDLEQSYILYSFLLEGIPSPYSEDKDEILRNQLEEEFCALKQMMVSAGCCYQKAINGDADAMAELGKRYLLGMGVTWNYDESLKWFRLAIDVKGQAAQNKSEQGAWRNIVLFVKDNRNGIVGAVIGASLFLIIYWISRLIIGVWKERRGKLRANESEEVDLRVESEPTTEEYDDIFGDEEIGSVDKSDK